MRLSWVATVPILLTFRPRARPAMVEKAHRWVCSLTLLFILVRFAEAEGRDRMAQALLLGVSANRGHEPKEYAMRTLKTVALFVAATWILAGPASSARGRKEGRGKNTGGGETRGTPPKPEPFAFADFSWVPGNYGASERPLKTSAFTGEFRVDTAYHHSFNEPQDNTISGSSEVFRHGEFQLTQLGHRRRLQLQERARPAHDAVRHVLADDSAQRREPGARAVEPGRRLSLHLRGLRRLPHQQV